MKAAQNCQKPLHLEICFGGTYAFHRQIVAPQMSCIFCRSEGDLTDEHVFPAFMGGELEVQNGSCGACNREFGIAEATLREATTPLLNLLQIENRYGVVPNASLTAQIRGMDMKNLPAFIERVR
ncbi:MAG: hypothetical protein DMG49_15170 [Acidobacteria bacterium]|nr:MAG: hypothetical protein DMG49_15170 [Acidobacteriota bacterium]